MIDAGVLRHFEEYVAEMEKLLAENDQWGSCKHLESTVGMGGKSEISKQFIGDEDGALTRQGAHS